MPSADNISHNIYRWERGAVTPAERYQLYYCGAFGIPFSQFGTAPPGMVDADRGAAAAPAYRELPSSDPAAPDSGAAVIRREVLMAAHEGSEHAERAEQRGIGEATLEQFRADVVQPVRAVPDRRAVRACSPRCGGSGTGSPRRSSGGSGRGTPPSSTCWRAASAR